MKYLYATAAIAASLVAAPAFAADISGARIEGIVGYDSPKVSGLEKEIQEFGIDVDADLDGILYGVGIGYDFAVGNNISLGVDAEYSDSSSDFNLKNGDELVTISFARDLYVGSRITTAVSDSFNLYGKLGYTNARASVGYYDGDEGFGIIDNIDGVRAGFGGQFALGGNSYVGLEYRYSNYESDLERHQVAATLGFRF
ncbi:porin family protein [Allosphingosinicella flava]|uniref:Porin family protein n=1 Tax=Allosphingosinicella flava TaxID=2771430 RepID=A0A7T2GL77_9SPHN|nr:outer membrane beta-barrel protein [Sphingosinicella flava]QPQ55911.1 porin family protein [Sphingosinicella flava]